MTDHCASPISAAELATMVEDGLHWLMVRGAHATSVQALTEDGYDALCLVLGSAGVPQDFLTLMGLKIDGRYVTALPLELGAETLAKVLTDSDLPGVCVNA